MRVLCAGGGSGGHVTPVLAVINELAKADPDLEVMFVCDKAFYEQARGLMATASVPVEVVTVPAGKFRRYSNTSLYQKIVDLSTHGKNARDLFKVIGGLSKSVRLLQKFRPACVYFMNRWQTSATRMRPPTIRMPRNCVRRPRADSASGMVSPFSILCMGACSIVRGGRDACLREVSQAGGSGSRRP